MEWVETTGRSVEEALDAALDELGVDEDEVEYEVLEAGRGGLWGRRDARIRARVKPVSREKPGDQRRRGRRNGGRGGEGKEAPGAPRSGKSRSGKAGGAAAAGPPTRSGNGDRGRTRRQAEPKGSKQPRGNPVNRDTASKETGEAVSETIIDVEEQTEGAVAFARGLMEAFGVRAEVATRVEADDAVLVEITGDDLGLLVGPKGVTVQAIEELVRTVVQRQADGRGIRIRVDVAGYRAKRREALTAFSLDLAAKVRQTGRDLALEPMPASDRKVVHDAVAELEDVSSVSEGEEPRRRVILRRV